METGSIGRRDFAAWAAGALFFCGAAVRPVGGHDAAIPPIDAAAPAKTATATFALG